MSDASTNLGPTVPSATQRWPGWLYAVLALLATVFLYFASQTIGVIAILYRPIVEHWPKGRTDAWLSNPPVEAQFVSTAISYAVFCLKKKTIYHIIYICG